MKRREMKVKVQLHKDKIREKKVRSDGMGWIILIGFVMRAEALWRQLEMGQWSSEAPVHHFHDTVSLSRNFTPFLLLPNKLEHTQHAATYTHNCTHSLLLPHTKTNTKLEIQAEGQRVK